VVQPPQESIGQAGQVGQQPELDLPNMRDHSDGFSQQVQLGVEPQDGVQEEPQDVPQDGAQPPLCGQGVPQVGWAQVEQPAWAQVEPQVVCGQVLPQLVCGQVEQQLVCGQEPQQLDLPNRRVHSDGLPQQGAQQALEHAEQSVAWPQPSV
jgi:hypothetical protein